MSPDRQKLFVQTLAAIFQARQEVADLFFQHRVTEMAANILESYIQWQIAQGPANLKRTQDDHIRLLRRADALFEEISYLKKGDPIAFAAARERILFYVHEILKTRQSVVLPKAAVPQAPAKQSLTSNQEKILEFVRQAPERRAKEIIDELKELSARTIKRALKELSKEGLIIRKEDQKAVYYSAAR